MMNLALRSIFVHACKWLFTCRKILWYGASVFEPATLGCNDKHANHYITEATHLKMVCDVSVVNILATIFHAIMNCKESMDQDLFNRKKLRYLEAEVQNCASAKLDS
jgi:hypothetical protein